MRMRPFVLAALLALSATAASAQPLQGYDPCRDARAPRDRDGSYAGDLTFNSQAACDRHQRDNPGIDQARRGGSVRPGIPTDGYGNPRVRDSRQRDQAWDRIGRAI